MKLALSSVAGCTLALLGFVAVPCVSAATITVTSSNPSGWTLYETGVYDNAPASNGGSANFVNGPGTPPLGTGSAHLQTGAGFGDSSVQLRNDSWAGVLISSLTALSYSTYGSAWNGQQMTYLTLYLDLDGDGTYDSNFDDRLHFEPDYSSAGAGNGNPSPQPAPVLGQWQEWNLLTGMWYSDTLGGPGSNAITLGTYTAANPTAQIVNPTGSFGGIRITSGFASDTDNFNMYVDAFTIGTGRGITVYDFELQDAATAVPEPASMLLLGSGLAAVAARRRRRG